MYLLVIFQYQENNIIGGYNTMKNLKSLFGMDVEEFTDTDSYDDDGLDFEEDERKTAPSHTGRTPKVTNPASGETKNSIKEMNSAYVDWLRDSAYLLKLAESDDSDPDILVQADFKTWAVELRAVLAKAPKSVVTSKKTINKDDFKDLWFMQTKKAK